jgi:hypothetical protein
MYIVYKTTNKLDGKIYIGIHKTSGSDFDGYYGSGLLLWKAIDKYGKENFERETLYTVETIEEARNIERLLVDAEFCERVDTYNISIGGTGGNTLAGLSEEEKRSVYEKRKQTSIQNGSYIVTGELLLKKQELMRRVRTQPQNKGRVHKGQALQNIIEAAANRRGKFVWVNDGTRTYLIESSELNTCGLVRGRGPDIERFTHHTEDAKKKIADKIRGDVCYNDGTRNIKLKIGDTPPPGFVKGMIQKHRNRKWFTDGSTNKFVMDGDPIPSGDFRPGRTFKKRKKE